MEMCLESQKLLEQFQISSSKLIDDLETFIDTRSSINENFKFWCQFLTRHTITLDLLRADREGLWHLHLDAMQRALYEFAAWMFIARVIEKLRFPCVHFAGGL